MEDKIRRLSQKVIEADEGSEEFQAAIVELRAAISRHVDHLRQRLYQYPLSEDKRACG